MSRITKFLWLLTASLLLVLSACGGAAPTVSPQVLYTQIAQTVLAQIAETAQAASPTPEATITPLVSPTSEASDTPLVSDTPQAATNTPLLSPTSGVGTPSQTPLTIATLPPPAGASCDNAAFVTDVTYPDGVAVQGGTTITKTWRFKNLGPCTWNRNYNLGFAYGGAGTDWAGRFPVNLPSIVKPGDTVDISVKLYVPKKVGGYGVYVRLQNDKGYYFGPTQIAVYVVVKQ